MSEKIRVKWETECARDYFDVDAADFEGMTPEEIEFSLQEQIDESASLFATAYCADIDAVIQKITDELAKTEAQS